MFAFIKQSYLILKQSYSTANSSLLLQALKERSLLRLKGNDASVYLQGLITNDMKHFEDGASSIYTMFLNSKGRVLYDSIVYNSNENNAFFIECDLAAALALKDHLLHYKVRRKVSIDLVNEELNIWAVAQNDYLKNVRDVCDYKKIYNTVKEKLSNIIVTIDPRISSMGLRILAPKNQNIVSEIKNLTGIESQEQDFYKLLRYELGVGEGLQELPYEKCFPMEVNGDYLHGISFHKGCYIGQELTARTYHTGAIRKRIMPLTFSEEMKTCEPGIPIFAVSQTNKSIGKLFGVNQTAGVGLLRIEEALKADELMISNVKCKTHRPFWWPTEAPKTRMKTV